MSVARGVLARPGVRADAGARSGAIADCLFTAGLFDYPLPERFAAIMPSRSLI